MLSSNQIISNWARFLDIIENNLSPERAEILLPFYQKYEDRFSMMPSSERDWKNSAYSGGYIDHILRVYDVISELNQSWINNGAHVSFTQEEMIFCALHFDLGKFGTFDDEYYILNDSQWHVKNLGMIYKYNERVPAVKNNERGLFILQSLGINLSFEEYMAIKLCDGLYDDSNKFYFYAAQKETKIKSYLPFLLHHSITQASQIEFQRWINSNIAEDFKQSIINEPISKDFDKDEKIKTKPASKAYKTQRISSLESVKNNTQISSKTLDIINNLFKD